MNGAARVALLGLFAGHVLIAPALAQKAPSPAGAKPAPSSRAQAPFDIKGFRVGDSFESVKLKFSDDPESFVCNQTDCLVHLNLGAKVSAYYRISVGEPIILYRFLFRDGVLQVVLYTMQRSAIQPLRAAITDSYGPPSEPCKPNVDCTEIVWRRGGDFLVLKWSNGTTQFDQFVTLRLSTPNPPGTAFKTRDF